MCVELLRYDHIVVPTRAHESNRPCETGMVVGPHDADVASGDGALVTCATLICIFNHSGFASYVRGETRNGAAVTSFTHYWACCSHHVTNTVTKAQIVSIFVHECRAYDIILAIQCCGGGGGGCGGGLGSRSGT
jgi:hypothetical protein